MSNFNLKKAKKLKNDEFFTLYEDIANEMKYYIQFFENKTIYCNCDHPTKSNFPKYFIDNFDKFKIKRLICTSYNKNGKGYYLDTNKHNYNDIKKQIIPVPELEGNGDFRSEECLKYLRDADIIITNPPFSLWREYVKVLFKHNKKYIIMGNLNTAFCKDMFGFICSKKMWEGVTLRKGTTCMYVPENEKIRETCVKLPFIRWFTNLVHGKKNPEIDLMQKYMPDKYFKYDNTDIINIDNVVDIPNNYYGIMGVPITYWDKHNEKQFEILGLAAKLIPNDIPYMYCDSKIDGKYKYKRILIKRRWSDKYG